MLDIGFSGCCCAAILKGFGGSRNAVTWDVGDMPRGIEHAKSYIREQVRAYRVMGNSQLVIITNNEQNNVNNALMDMMDEEDTEVSPLIIHYTPWMASRKHGTLVRTWILQLQCEPSKHLTNHLGVDNE